MLAYLSWHRPAPAVDAEAYERALEQFHRSLAHRAPSGFRGSATFRAAELPWLAPAGEPATAPAYEDWYLLDDWAALGVLEEAAVSRGHVSSHDKVASLSGVSTGAVYRFLEGHAGLNQTHVAVWVARSSGHEHPSLSALLGDGMDPAVDGLWRRCLGLGPAPEFCMLASEAAAGVAPSRLPKGWTATTLEREALWRG
ncbi:MAG: hypothetical protein ABSG93_11860 [Solirubrobacteraceae bacterium]|jgi:hypothetical protein